MHAHRERPEWGSVYARNEAMKDVFARCFKKTAVQVCTVIICSCHLVMSCNSCIMLLFLHSGKLIHNTVLICVYFCRLKINHDSPEFILESGAVENTNSHQCEQFVKNFQQFDEFGTETSLSQTKPER
jgi:hypothetical protein